MDNGKIDRVLGLYSKFMQGSLVNKAEETLNYGVNERTIQRDIDDIRNHLETTVVDTGVLNSIIYDREKRAYRLEQIYQMKLINGEILSTCKILLDSRLLPKEDMGLFLKSDFLLCAGN